MHSLTNTHIFFIMLQLKTTQLIMHHKLTLFIKKIPSVLLSKMVQEFQVLHYLLLERLEITLVISILVGVFFFLCVKGNVFKY